MHRLPLRNRLPFRSKLTGSVASARLSRKTRVVFALRTLAWRTPAATARTAGAPKSWPSVPST